MMDPRSRLVAFAIVAACSDSGGGSASQGSTGASAAGDWGPVGSGDGVAYERAHFVLKSGAHSVEAGDDAKVGITVVGYDVAVSFGYAGGSGAAFIGAAPVPPPQ
jgi:hypothetical protein